MTLDTIRLFFSRLRNSDGSFDSMCTKCFSPVARNVHEGIVEEMEDAHVCGSGESRWYQLSDREQK